MGDDFTYHVVKGDTFAIIPNVTVVISEIPQVVYKEVKSSKFLGKPGE